MVIVLPIVISAILILINGLFVASEFAIIGVRRTRMAQLANQGNRVAAGILEILDDPLLQDRYISTAQLGITIASLGLGMYAEEAFAELLLGPLEHLVHLSESAAHGVAAAIALSLLTFFHVVVGEMVPKSLALQFPESTVFRVSKPMGLMQKLFGPAVWFLNTLGAGIMRLMRIPLVEGHARLHSPEELQMIINDSFRSGQIEAEEKVMLSKVFLFGEHKAHQVMTHRTRVEAYPIEISESELLPRLAESNFSRFPIFRGDLDNVVGVLHLKDLIRQQIHRPAEFDLRSLLRRAPVVPECADVEDVLAMLKQQRLAMAMVIDEYGGLAGIVTLEDLVEEVVGEVQDEFDHEIAPIRQVGPRQYIVRGDFPVEDLDRLSPLGDKDLDVNSVGGLIVSLLDRMPLVGDSVTYAGVVLTVKTLSGRAIQTAHLRLPPRREAN
jgi:CBS domain containing-hemolysin-like protein